MGVEIKGLLVLASKQMTGKQGVAVRARYMAILNSVYECIHSAEHHHRAVVKNLWSQH